MNAAVWSNLIAALSALAGVSSAIIAGFQAAKSRKAATDAEEALAMILRPEFVPSMGGDLDPEITVRFGNVARHDAIDVSATITTADGRELGQGSIHRVPGHVPNTLGDEPVFHVLIRDLPAVRDVGGDSYDLVMTLRFMDVRNVKMWRQELRVTRTLVEENGRRYMQGVNHLSLPVGT